VYVCHRQLFRTPKIHKSACFGNPFSQLCWKFCKRSVVSERVSNIPNDFLIPSNLMFRQKPRNKLFIYIYTYICICIYIYIHTHTHTQNIRCYVDQKTQNLQQYSWIPSRSVRWGVHPITYRIQRRFHCFVELSEFICTLDNAARLCPEFSGPSYPETSSSDIFSNVPLLFPYIFKLRIS